MPDERDQRHPDPDMVALIAQAVARQISNIGREEVVDNPPTMNGRDASAIKRTIAIAIDDELSRRRVLSDTEIRVIAKEVATQIVESSIRVFLTESQIEEIVYGILTALGFPADSKDERKITKEIVEGLLRGHKLRARIGGGLIDETVKALISQAIAGGAIAAIGALIWSAIKGGGHQ